MLSELVRLITSIIDIPLAAMVVIIGCSVPYGMLMLIRAKNY